MNPCSCTRLLRMHTGHRTLQLLEGSAPASDPGVSGAQCAAPCLEPSGEPCQPEEGGMEKIGNVV